METAPERNYKEQKMITKITKDNIIDIAETLDTFYRLTEEYHSIIGDRGYNSNWHRPKITIDLELMNFSIETGLSRVAVPIGADCETLSDIDCLKEDYAVPELDVYDYVAEHYDGLTAFSFSWTANLTDYEVTVDLLRTRFAAGGSDVAIA